MHHARHPAHRHLGAPLFTGPDDPQLKATVGVVFALFGVVIAAQVLHQRRRQRSAPLGATSARP